MFLLMGAPFAFIAGRGVLAIMRPTELLFVVEEHNLRFGSELGMTTVPRDSIRELRFESGTDQDLAVAILKNARMIQLPTEIIGSRHGDLAHKIAEAWPEVDVWLRAVPLNGFEKSGPPREN